MTNDIPLKEAKKLLREKKYRVGEKVFKKYRVTYPDGYQSFWSLKLIKINALAIKKGEQVND